MSRARRKPRHRRSPRLLTQVAPVALGGAVAAVALTAGPLDGLLRRPPGAGSAEARPGEADDRTGRQLVQVEPAGDSRADGAASPSAGEQRRSGAAGSGRSAPLTSTAAVRAIGATRARHAATSRAGSTPSDSPAPLTGSTPEPTGRTQPGGPSLPVPLPTPSTTSLPLLPVPLPTLSLPVSLPVTLR